MINTTQLYINVFTHQQCHLQMQDMSFQVAGKGETMQPRLLQGMSDVCKHHLLLMDRHFQRWLSHFQRLRHDY